MAEARVQHFSLPLRVYAALLTRLSRWFGIKFFLIYRRELADGANVRPELGPGYRFVELDEQALLGFAADPALDLSSAFVKDAVQRGDICFGVLHGEELAAYRWYSFAGSTRATDGLWFHYAHPERTYGYKTFTVPQHRGKRLHVLTMDDSDAVLASRGCTHAVGYIDAYNLPSLRAYSRQRNAKLVGIVASFKAFGRRFCIAGPGAVRNHVGMSSRG